MSEIEARRARESQAKQDAKASGKNVSYIDSDGCEVTVTPDGHIFFNVGDWY